MTEAPAGVTLEQMLEARDRRAARQRAALARLGLPVVSVTLVMPGPIKDGPVARFAMNVAAPALEALLQQRGWAIGLIQPTSGACGPEAIYAVEADPTELKLALAGLEDGHPLGRLWDFDVICPKAGQIGRRAVGQPPRRCLLCDEDAHACARSRRHPLPDLLAAIERLVDDYRRSPAA